MHEKVIGSTGHKKYQKVFPPGPDLRRQCG
jgi:hypothetical protein